MTPNKSCKRTATSAPRGDLLGASVPSRSNTKSFLMMFLLVGLLDEASASTNLHRPCTTLNESKIHESWTFENPPRSCHGRTFWD